MIDDSLKKEETLEALCEELSKENSELKDQVTELQSKYERVIRELCDSARDEIDRTDYVNKLYVENKNLKKELLEWRGNDE
jgi:predicted RNase H-like nuclease (RuvC/YqgF family)